MSRHAPPVAPTLLIGIGNSARGDDGLGWAFLDYVQNAGAYTGALEYRYQLQIEDAARIRHEQQVLFVDASMESLAKGFEWRRCVPMEGVEFTSHALAPAAVLRLCRDLFHRSPDTRLLLIEGRDWTLGTGLSAVARRHLAAALRSFDALVRRRDIFSVRKRPVVVG